jgi:hypothetical protein
MTSIVERLSQLSLYSSDVVELFFNKGFEGLDKNMAGLIKTWQIKILCVRKFILNPPKF